MKAMRRLGFFGGTFDPVHMGHLQMAGAAIAELNLSKVIFVPARRNPLKASDHLFSDVERLQLLQLAVAGQTQFGIWQGELDREGPSYTGETVNQLSLIYPNCHLFWIIGSDQLPTLVKWHRIREWVSRIHFIVVQRPGFPFVAPGIPGIRLFELQNSLNPVSSSAIRQQLASGHIPHELLPPAVSQWLAARPR